MSTQPRHTVIEQEPPHHPVHVWLDADDQPWACCAYDHGPFCRLCQRVDGTMEALLENVQEGKMVAKAAPDGEFRFKVTAQGIVAAEELIGTNPELAVMWAELQRRWDDS